MFTASYAAHLFYDSSAGGTAAQSLLMGSSGWSLRVLLVTAGCKSSGGVLVAADGPVRCSSAASAAEARARAQLQRLALAAARREREAADLRLQDDARRLGALTVARAGPIGEFLWYPIETWLR